MSWLRAAILFPLFTAVGGVISGLVLGAAGSRVPVDLRLALSSVLALSGVILGGLESVGRSLRPLQCDRETPKRWVEEGSVAWAMKNGLALGCGASSRLGFWLWYVIPLGAFLFGSATLGAVIYGTYGLVRGVSIWAFLLARVSVDSEAFIVDWTRRLTLARMATGVSLLFVSGFSVGAVGLG